MRNIITVILGIICAGLFLLSLSAIEVTQNRIRDGREGTVEFTDKNTNELDAGSPANNQAANKEDPAAADNGIEAETNDTQHITEESEITEPGGIEPSGTESNAIEPSGTESSAIKSSAAGSNTSQTNTNPAAPVLNLLKDKVEIKVGDKFNPLDYIAGIVDDKSSQQYLYRQIMVDGEYNTEAAGTYILIYTVADEDGNVSVGKKLYLTVK